MEAPKRRGRVLFLVSITNLTVLVMLAVLWSQGTLTPSEAAVFAVCVLLVVNGAMWLGWHLAHRGGRKGFKPVVFFTLSGFVAVDGIVEIISGNYSSAGTLFLSALAVLVLGVLNARAARRNAERQNNS